MKFFQKLLPKMGKFHSKMLPLTYKNYPTKDVILNARKPNQVTIFDVSQMNSIKVNRDERNIKKIERLFPINLERLKENKAELSVVLDEKCNILDDFIVTNNIDNFRFIINSESFSLFNRYFCNASLQYTIGSTKIIAVQGDGSNKLLEELNLPTNMKFMENINHEGLEITRCGYTGMDGFEIIGHEDDLEKYLEKMINNENVRVGGLIERDILRLEAGFCLSGNEFGPNKNIHFNEANLDFIIKKRRRNEKNFIGGEFLQEEPKKIRKSFISNVSLVGHNNIYNEEKEKVGLITSASYSHNLEKFIGMGYVDKDYNNKIFINRRNKYEEIYFK